MHNNKEGLIMFKKSVKKITGILAAAAIMVGITGNTMSVLAANTSDTAYAINVESSSGSFKGV